MCSTCGACHCLLLLSIVTWAPAVVRPPTTLTLLTGATPPALPTSPELVPTVSNISVAKGLRGQASVIFVCNHTQTKVCCRAAAERRRAGAGTLDMTSKTMGARSLRRMALAGVEAGSGSGLLHHVHPACARSVAAAADDPPPEP
ncbi:hypothetical protein EDC01DRAFT_634206 [Geopyxis carbonaria]|nr:hypothetical protein EDC01DRAFT_634206 [Geopyxis carbonaria]